MEKKEKKKEEKPAFVEGVTSWVGSGPSLVLHTFVFLAAFLLGVFKYAEWDMVLLILTTAVSLEAIYLAIFIQMTINRHTKSLQEIQEDVEEDEKREKLETATLETLARDMRAILGELEELKKK